MGIPLAEIMLILGTDLQEGFHDKFGVSPCGFTEHEERLAVEFTAQRKREPGEEGSHGISHGNLLGCPYRG